MPAFLSRVSHAPSNVMHVDLRHKSGTVGHVVDFAETVGGAYAAARVNTQFEGASWLSFRGHNSVELGGAVLKLAVLGADILGFNSGALPHLNSLATGVLAAAAAAKGAQDGQAAHKAPAPALASVPARRTISGTSIGHIPPAPQPGRYLDLSEVQRVAAMHG